jgi:hypothetical protein
MRRGRKSAAELEMEPLMRRAEPTRVQPPASLSEAARGAFLDLVVSCDPEHFEDSDVTLLARYANAVVFSEQAEAQLQANPDDAKALTLWEKATRTMSGLALRLRLGPQSRREKAKAPRRSIPWDEQFALEQTRRRF